MFILGNFFSALAHVLNALLLILTVLVFLRALISWVSPDPFNPLVQFLYRTTEPFLEPIRRFLPPLAIDISPLILLLVVHFLREFLINSLFGIAYRLQ